ncbi:MAG TPA: DegQ family serine endoprotease [Clostridia bacterium]|nr:DegQ family serine endoprotease [Clostridia bacterium]
MKTFLKHFYALRAPKRTSLRSLKKTGILGSSIVVVVMVQWFLSCFSISAASKNTANTTNPPARLTIQDAPLNRDLRAPVSFAPVAKKVGPSVVNIYSTMTIKERPLQSPLFNDPLFRRFFGDDFDPRRQPRERKAQSLGSGVIVSPNGYILTASHVVEGADVVKVAMSEGDKEVDAKVIGVDPPTDIAVLKIEADKDLPTVAMADSDKLEVGDTVLAVGNPFGVGQTVTLGIISGLSRGGFGITGYEDFIQTDAAINPGNSGGALVDAEGRLVGINTAILSRSGGFQGVGFAVPVNMVRYVMDRLITHGKVSRGYLGINIQALTPELAKEFRLPDESSGVLVGGVSPNSAAAKAGLREGDVIVQVNGKKVTDPRSLQLVVAQNAPGTKVDLRFLRGENNRKPAERTVTAVLGELPQEIAAGGSRSSPEDDEGQQSMDALDGIEVTDLDAAVRRQLEVPRNVRGALVVNVDPSSSAAEAGLRQGDVIVEINRQPVRSADDAVNLSQKVKEDRVLLRVWSRSGSGAGGTRYVVVDNSKNK